MKKFAVIGGTGLYDLPGLANVQDIPVSTSFGEPSATIKSGSLSGQVDILFLARHGNPHRIPPHCINYRANIAALKQLGVDGIIAVNAVGGISDGMDNGVIVIPDQIVDYTYGREHTYSDSSMVTLEHVDFSYPYDEKLRQHLMMAASTVPEAQSVGRGVYAATQGPRLESAAEINRLERDGCDVVGMTGMPEAALARELGLPYASLCLVVNRAAGRSEGIITMTEIESVMKTGMTKVRQILCHALRALGDQG